jgi:alpha 1,2-mannosyltransferase
MRIIVKLLKRIIKYGSLLISIYYLTSIAYQFLNKHRINKLNSVNNINVKNLNYLQEPRINACLFVLIRNKELKSWTRTMKQFEKNFNSKYNYPYIFMNDVEFSDHFKKTVSSLTQSKVEFGLISKEHWSIPKWIDQDDLKRKLQSSLGHMFRGTMMSYHHMCRYYSGFFFRHNLTLKYDYFWRIEPGVSFPCEISYDPFQTLVKNNKLYGFSIARPEMMDTIPSLWSTIRKWLDTGYKKYMPKNNAIDFISNDNGKTLNKKACTFFNNFEIGAFSVFRDPKYLNYFDYLDRSGGFFYERWGDSAINTFYLVMMLKKNQIHIYDDIAYFHPPRYYCPATVPDKCSCKLNKVKTSSYKRCFDKWNSITQIN